MVVFSAIYHVCQKVKGERKSQENVGEGGGGMGSHVEKTKVDGKKIFERVTFVSLNFFLSSWIIKARK